MGGRGGAGRTNASSQDSGTKSSVGPIGDRVLASLAKLGPKGDLISLARLRDSLPDVDRSTLDSKLKAMDYAREIQLDPDPNRKGISQRSKDAAIFYGGEDVHFITVL